MIDNDFKFNDTCIIFRNTSCKIPVTGNITDDGMKYFPVTHSETFDFESANHTSRVMHLRMYTVVDDDVPRNPSVPYILADLGISGGHNFLSHDKKVGQAIAIVPTQPLNAWRNDTVEVVGTIKDTIIAADTLDNYCRRRPAMNGAGDGKWWGVTSLPFSTWARSYSRADENFRSSIQSCVKAIIKLNVTLNRNNGYMVRNVIFDNRLDAVHVEIIIDATKETREYHMIEKEICKSIYTAMVNKYGEDRCKSIINNDTKFYKSAELTRIMNRCIAYMPLLAEGFE